MFSTQSDNCIPICPYFEIINLFAVELEDPKIGISAKEILDLGGKTLYLSFLHGSFKIQVMAICFHDGRQIIVSLIYV